MGANLQIIDQETYAPPSKNRVVGLGGVAFSYADSSAVQVVEPHQENDAVTTMIASGLTYTFIGGHGVWSEGDNLYHMKARYYDAGMKRFVSADPIGIAGGYNLYSYAAANPLFFLDPFGLSHASESGGQLWFDRWGSSVAQGSSFIQNTMENTYSWPVAGGINTVVQAVQGIVSLPQSIGHLGEGTGTFFGNPTLANSAGMFQDISLAAGVMAAGMSALPGARAPIGSSSSSGNMNPFEGPVDNQMFVSNPNGNVVPVQAGQALTGSPNGSFLQVRTGGVEGGFTGLRLDGAHTGYPYNHAHVPGVGNHLPVP